MTKKELNLLIKMIKQDFNGVLVYLEAMNKRLHRLDKALTDRKTRLGKK